MNLVAGLPQISKSPSLVRKTLLLCIVIGILAGSVGYYLGTLKGGSENQTSQKSVSTIIEESSVVPSIITTPPQVEKVAEIERPYGSFYDCPVEFDLPSKPANLSEDERFWSMRGGIHPPLLLKVSSNYGQKNAMYAAESEASGEIAMAVGVACAENTNKYKDTNDLTIEEYDGEIVKKYTILATPEYIYEVKIFSNVSNIDANLKTQAQKIFDSLSFEVL